MLLVGASLAIACGLFNHYVLPQGSAFWLSSGGLLIASVILNLSLRKIIHPTEMSLFINGFRFLLWTAIIAHFFFPAMEDWKFPVLWTVISLISGLTLRYGLKFKL